MPDVTSAVEARHEEHVQEGLGAMGTPHMQHKTVMNCLEGSVGMASALCIVKRRGSEKKMKEV